MALEINLVQARQECIHTAQSSLTQFTENIKTTPGDYPFASEYFPIDLGLLAQNPNTLIDELATIGFTFEEIGLLASEKPYVLAHFAFEFDEFIRPEVFRDPEQPLQGKHIVVTGGSAGFGRAAAMYLAGAGARITAIARTPIKLENFRQFLSLYFPTNDAEGHNVLPLDLAAIATLGDDELDMRLLRMKMSEADGLVFSSGGTKPGTKETISASDVASAMRNEVRSLERILSLGGNMQKVLALSSSTLCEDNPQLALSVLTRAYQHDLVRESRVKDRASLIPGAVPTRRLMQIFLARTRKGKPLLDVVQAMENEHRRGFLMSQAEIGSCVKQFLVTNQPGLQLIHQNDGRTDGKEARQPVPWEKL